MLVAGVGINDSPYAVSQHNAGKQIWKCPVYTVWQNMLHRCYNPAVQAKHPTYTGIEVCEEWLSFDNFRLWAFDSYRDEYELDKDILLPGSKVYSPKTSVFVPRRLNLALKEYSTGTGGLWPLGVTFSRGKYVARVNDGEYRIYIGAFESPQTAHLNWQTRKVIILEGLLSETACGSPLERAWWKIIDKLHADIYNGRETKSFKEV